MSKQELEISRIDDTGKAVRQMQWLITLDAEIDIAALLDGSDRRPPALEMAEQAVSMLEGDREDPPTTARPMTAPSRRRRPVRRKAA
jgi:hypothetical protein